MGFLRSLKTAVGRPGGLGRGLIAAAGRLSERSLNASRHARAKFTFIDRRKKSEDLVYVLCGYKPQLWPIVLERVRRYTPESVDLCLVCSGKSDPTLIDLASKNRWSVLLSQANEVSLAQNLAIQQHPDARVICKIDEDIVVGKDYFSLLKIGFVQTQQAGLHRPGVIAPVLNVNGFTYVDFLRFIGKDQAYRQQFGELIQSPDKVKIHHDGQAAVWVWRHSLPFDDLVGQFASRPFEYTPTIHRFSIGLILFERTFWKNMGMFALHPGVGMLGHDESELCKYCCDSGQLLVVANNVFAGHWGFGPQNKTMTDHFHEFSPALIPA